MSEGFGGYNFDQTQGTRESYLLGQEIVKEGEAGDCLYVILSGGVEVSRNGELLAVLNVGEIFGEMALLDESIRSATITAILDTELLRIDRAAFQRLVQGDIQFANFMLYAFSRRLRHTSATAATMSKAVSLANLSSEGIGSSENIGFSEPAMRGQKAASHMTQDPSPKPSRKLAAPQAAVKRRPDPLSAETGRSPLKSSQRKTAMPSRTTDGQPSAKSKAASTTDPGKNLKEFKWGG